MIYWRNNRISDKQKQSLILIYKYRGLTNEHLREIIFGHLTSDKKGQKDNISRYTAGLKKMKLIASESCYPYSKELIHFLTKKGIEFVKDHVVIDSEQEFLGFDGHAYGDFEPVMLKPGLKNLEHTMMYLDFAIKHRNRLNVRHNLYSVKDFVYYYETETSLRGKRGKVRPDGEVLVKDKHMFCLELDTGSERFEQLVSKFENYRRYFDYCIESNLDIPWKGMLFVCKETKLEFSKDQRARTVLRAAVEGLKHYCWTFTIQVFRGEHFIIRKLLEENAEIFSQLDIPIPSNENPVLVEKQRKDEQLKREEEERKKRQEEARIRVQQQVQRGKLEYERKKQLEEEHRRREMEEEERKNKRFFGMGKLFS
jgi:hypothetical protein